MKQSQTIKKNREFTEIIRMRQVVGGAGLVLYYRKKHSDGNRIGISVGKKLGNAVVRNRAKRQVRAMIDEIFTFNETFDAIIIIKPTFNDFLYEENKKSLEKCYKKVKI
jgi:ribonuclease P protein component